MPAASRLLIIYWTTQVVAWCLGFGLFGLVTWLDGKYTPEDGRFLLCTTVMGIMGSHLYRALLLRMKWMELPIGMLVPRLSFAAVLYGVVLGLAQAVVHDIGFTAVSPVLGAEPGKLLGYMLDWAVLLFIWGMAYMGYHYFARSRREEIRALRLDAADRDNQLANLRSQLNPHFMFNALNGIRALIDEDPERAKASITQLSAILRNAMATVKRRTVPLGEELDMVKSYLALESMRFEERLRIQYDVDPSLEREPVPPMMLQTLVENAVRHGIAKLKEGGDVHISAQRGLTGMVLSVRNSGSYVPGPAQGSGIGLRNTRERLQRIYGDGASLTIANRDGMVVTEVELPAPAESDLRSTNLETPIAS